MSISVEERLRRAAELLDQTVVQLPAVDLRVVSAHHPHRGASPVWLRAASAVLVLAAMGGVAWMSSKDSSMPAASAPTTGGPEDTVAATSATETTAAGTDSTSGGSTETTLAEVQAVITLPLSDDLSASPVTVQGSGPSSWYRLQPDLDVAWYSNGTTTSQLCFRTPALTQCQTDRLAPSASGIGPTVAILGSAGQWLVVTLDEVDRVTLTLSDASVVEVQLARDPEIGWRVGRVVLNGARPTSASMVFDNSEQPTSDTSVATASVATLP